MIRTIFLISILLSLITNINGIYLSSIPVKSYPVSDGEESYIVRPPDGENNTSPGGNYFLHIPGEQGDSTGYHNNVMVFYSLKEVVKFKPLDSNTENKWAGDSISWDMVVDVYDTSLYPSSSGESSDYGGVILFDKSEQIWPDNPDFLKKRDRTTWYHYKLDLSDYLNFTANGFFWMVFFLNSDNFKIYYDTGHGIGIDNIKIYDDGNLVLQIDFENNDISPGTIIDLMQSGSGASSPDKWGILSFYYYYPRPISVSNTSWGFFKQLFK